MANNRMWLVNDRLNTRVLLAKYYPNTKWYIYDGFKVDAAFDQDDTDTMIGPTDWRLEYDIDDTPPSVASTPS